MNTPTPDPTNSVQHGGTHYRSGYQHWDWVVDIGLDYFSAAATKYLVRHRKKNGLEDVKKAGHFVDKMISLLRGNRVTIPTLDRERQRRNAELTARFLDANEVIDALDRKAIEMIALSEHITDLIKSRELIDRIEAEYLKPTAPPLVGEVSQFQNEGWYGNLQVMWKCRRCGTTFKAHERVSPGDAHPVCDAQQEPDPAEPGPGYVNQG